MIDTSGRILSKTMGIQSDIVTIQAHARKGQEFMSTKDLVANLHEGDLMNIVSYSDNAKSTNTSQRYVKLYGEIYEGKEPLLNQFLETAGYEPHILRGVRP